MRLHQIGSLNIIYVRLSWVVSVLWHASVNVIITDLSCLVWTDEAASSPIVGMPRRSRLACQA